jgi:hypothetical protein
MRAGDVLDDNAKLEVNSMEEDEAPRRRLGFFSKLIKRKNPANPFPSLKTPVAGSSSGKGKERSDPAIGAVEVNEGDGGSGVEEESDLDEATSKLKARSSSTKAESIPIASYDDLPDPFKESVRHAHIHEDELRADPHCLFVALSCLHFFSKQPFLFQLPGEEKPFDFGKVIVCHPPSPSAGLTRERETRPGSCETTLANTCC